MALLWIDSFDTYVAHTASTSTTTPLLPANYPTVTAINIFRDSGNTLTAVSQDGGTYSQAGLTWALPAAKSTGSLGMGAHFYSSGVTDSWCAFFELLDAGSNIKGTAQLDSAGSISITGYGSATSVQSFPLNEWHHIEAKVTFGSGTSGKFEVRLDGAPFISVTGVDTSATIQYIRLLHKNTSGFKAYMQVRDLYVWDESGTVNNDWMGEQNTYTYYPSADTAQADWTLSSGTSGFDLLNDPPGSSTNYITTDTVGNISEFDLTDIPITNIGIQGVSTFVSADKTGTEDTTIAVGLDGNYSPDIHLSQNAFSVSTFIQEQNPSTSADWTVADINAAVISIKRTA